MGQTQSRKIASKIKTNTVEIAQINQKMVALEERTVELEQAARAIYEEKAEYEQKLADMSETIGKQVLEKMEIQKAECEQRLAVMSQTMDKLVQERMKENAQSERKLVAMSEKMDKLVLEKTVEKAKHDQKLVAMSETINQLVQEKTEENAQSERKLVAMFEKMDKLVLEKTLEKAKHDQKLVAMSETMNQFVQEKTEENAQSERKLVAMSEKIDKLVLEKTVEKAKHDQKLVAMSETINQLVQEKTEENAQSEWKLVAMSEKMDKLFLENTEEKAKHDQKLVAMSETINQLVQEKTEENAQSERKLVAMSEKMDKLFLENTEEKARMVQKVVALEERNLELEQAARAMSEEKAEYEQKLVAMSETMNQFVQEKNEENAKRDLIVVALMNRIFRLEQEARTRVPEFEQKLDVMSVKIDSLVLEREKERPEIHNEQDTSSESNESTNSLLPEERLEETSAESEDLTVEPSTSGFHYPSTVRSDSSYSMESNSSSSFQSDSSDQSLSQRPQSSRASSEEQTTAQDSSSVSQLQEEVRQLPPEQSLKKKRKTKHCKEPMETSNDWLLDPDLEPELKEVFTLLNSNEGSKIINGLELIHQIAQTQPELLVPKMEAVCVVTLREVLNPWETMSHAALRTLSELLFLEGYFDPFLDQVVDVLFEKATSDSIILQEAVNAVLGQMVQHCDLTSCMGALLNGLSNQRRQDPVQDVAVRECFAMHALALAEFRQHWLFYGTEVEMLERFIDTIRDLTQDSSEVVRSCAESTMDILEDLMRNHFSP